MKRAEAIAWLEIMKEDAIFEQHDALRMAIKALQGDMYCPNCGVRLVQENEYLEPTHTHGRLIDAEFEEKHYASMLLNPSPDVTAKNKEDARIILGALKMAKTVSADEQIQCMVEKRVAELVHLNYEL